MGRYPRRQHTWTDGRGAGPGRLQPAGVRTIGEQLRGHLPLPAADHQQQVTVDAVAVLAQARRDFQSGEVKLHLGDESKKLTYAQRRELGYDRGSSHFEHEPVQEVTLDDLVPDEFSPSVRHRRDRR